jgi:hypothetical protein
MNRFKILVFSVFVALFLVGCPPYGYRKSDAVIVEKSFLVGATSEDFFMALNGKSFEYKFYNEVGSQIYGCFTLSNETSKCSYKFKGSTPEGPLDFNVQGTCVISSTNTEQTSYQLDLMTSVIVNYASSTTNIENKQITDAGELSDSLASINLFSGKLFSPIASVNGDVLGTSAGRPVIMKMVAACL